MNTEDGGRRGISWFIQADRYSCVAVTMLVLLVCGASVLLIVLAAPAIRSLRARTLPQPTPTIAPMLPGIDVALKKPATVSHELPAFPAYMAVDGSPANWWSSGGHPPQWIEIDLGANYVISQVRLLPSQSPPGQTSHRLLVNGTATDGRSTLIHTFEGFTEDSTWLILKLPEPLRGVRFIRVETTTSPSWVGWREIHVISGE